MKSEGVHPTSLPTIEGFLWYIPQVLLTHVPRGCQPRVKIIYVKAACTVYVTKFSIIGLVFSISSAWDFWNKRSKNNLRGVTLRIRPIKPVQYSSCSLTVLHYILHLCTRCVCFLCDKFAKMFTCSGFLFFYSSTLTFNTKSHSLQILSLPEFHFSRAREKAC